MKFIFLLATSLLFGSRMLAQVCSTYYFMRPNATVEQSHFDDKGKLALKTEYKVGEIKTVDEGAQAAVQQKVVDKKGKVISEGTANIRCNGANLYIDMKLSMPAGPVAPGGNMEASSKNVYMPYPVSMKPGDNLENAQFSMSMDQASIVQTIELFVRNRKAELAESVTTPAGTWDCIKINFEMEIVTRTAGIRIPMRVRGSEWYAPGFGVVKTQSFNKNGKLTGSSEITSIR
jgi:uncharacterized protein DUF3108